MTSIDELSNLISADVQKSDETRDSVTGSKSHADELAAQFRLTNADGKTGGALEVKRLLEEAQGIQANVKAKLEEARTMAEALKSGGLPAGAGTWPGMGLVPDEPPQQASRRPVTVRAQISRPSNVPATWSHDSADSGKGDVWQRPGATGNADMVRVMEATQRYPHGYVRFYNAYGQPIGLNGKPGSRADTHVPITADGTYKTPQGWHHD